MKSIYFDVKRSIKDLQRIFEDTDGGDEKLKKSNQKSLELFQKLEFESLKELESLTNNEEWENFTIAFYGETGAGKSTLIEALRLFFKEQSKIDQQERFKRLYLDYGKNHSELEKLQDGAIIGDGRSDFTLETKSYTFKHGDQNFVLLDVPGIEGDEKKVIEKISDATQKAHAVFYVTKKPTPPQKGEEGKEGTIEKIQKQLDAQTEVYTLFNKPITNPRALKDGLINESEEESLRGLNKEMKNILGKHYIGYTAVSAQVAFYGLSSALLPESDFYRNKQKFLEAFEKEALLNRTRFNQLARFISEDLLKNSRAKIIESNCNKALRVVEKLQEAIKKTIDRQIKPAIKETKKYHLEVCDRLDNSRKKFVSNLENSSKNEINRFRFDLSREMHARIERGIEDDKECENIFKDEFLQGMEKLRENIKERFEKNEQQFRNDIQEDIRQFKKRIEMSLAYLERTNIDHGGFDFDLNIDTDSGIEWLGLASSAVGLGFGIGALIGAANFWNPIGWAAIGLGLGGIVKSVWNFFDSDYRKSQQRRAVDKSLNTIGKNITERMESQLQDAKKDIIEKIEKLKALLNGPVDDCKRQKRQLEKANERLWDIEASLMTSKLTSKQGAHNE
ncbi:GTPase [Helicobacter pylori]|uniref:Uncharacterized protein n=1 Tax=Helicobacter pylori TaxID=210 RepID=A0A1A9HB84_HELPX|nr:GTPase [Helicobacter pylori]ANH46835.1 hypothetical protein AA973_03010 [Helicobacter pylori]